MDVLDRASKLCWAISFAENYQNGDVGCVRNEIFEISSMRFGQENSKEIVTKM